MVNGHVLPPELVLAIRRNWIHRIDRSRLESHIGYPTDFLHFFELDYLTGKLAADWLLAPPEYRGDSGSESEPGDLDPSRSVVIGEISPDCPLAIDFRGPTPTVVALLWPGWVLLAPNVADFLDMLDPDGHFRQDVV